MVETWKLYEGHKKDNEGHKKDNFSNKPEISRHRERLRI
jgi:hypothetical protein